MKTIDELGISQAPWTAGVYGFVRDGSRGDNPHYVASCATNNMGANARLIAAAPELYECLRKFYDLEFPIGYEGVDGEWLALAKATEKALSKASGEEAK